MRSVNIPLRFMLVVWSLYIENKSSAFLNACRLYLLLKASTPGHILKRSRIDLFETYGAKNGVKDKRTFYGYMEVLKRFGFIWYDDLRKSIQVRSWDRVVDLHTCRLNQGVLGKMLGKSKWKYEFRFDVPWRVFLAMCLINALQRRRYRVLLTCFKHRIKPKSAWLESIKLGDSLLSHEEIGKLFASGNSLLKSIFLDASASFSLSYLSVILGLSEPEIVELKKQGKENNLLVVKRSFVKVKVRTQGKLLKKYLIHRIKGVDYFQLPDRWFVSFSTYSLGKESLEIGGV